MPAAAITNDANQAALVSDTTEAISFNTVLYDTSGFYSSDEPTRLTAPVPGIYLVTANAAFSANTTGLRVLNISINGEAADAPGGVQTVTNGSDEWDTSVSVATQVKLAAGDYVEAQQGAPGTSGTIEIVSAGDGKLPALALTWLDDA